MRISKYLICALSLCTTLISFTTQAKAADAAQAKVALNGMCAVCLVEGGKLVPGSSDFAVNYDGYTYQFPSANESKMFSANPEKYAPVMNGDCVVCAVKGSVRMPGNVKFLSKHAGRIYLFPGEDQKKMFDMDPKSFEQADLAHQGNCVVCLAKSGKNVPGKSEFQVRRDGFRFLFPSKDERDMFVSAPEKFVVSVTGTTDCAACTYKVRPLNSPGELGLAVKTNLDQVYIVEEAHKNYADVYAKRFDKNKVTVTGTPVKTEGKYTWIQPIFLSTK